MEGQHVYYECDCNRPGCQFCDGGLGYCTVCGGAEGSLTIECCGRKITKHEEDRIYYGGNLDFHDGDWWKTSNYGRSSQFTERRPEPTDFATQVVHCKREDYDVLIDRTTKWGNPFEMGKDGDRMEAIAKHMGWLIEQPDLLASLEELRGKKLGCWCDPKPCHGDNYVFLLEGVWV
jgi:hypothetical protein